MAKKAKVKDFEVEVKTKKVTAKAKKEGDKLDVTVDTEKVDVEVHTSPEEKHFKLDGKKLDVEVKQTAEGTEVIVESESNFLRKVGKYIGTAIDRRFRKRLV